MSNIKRDTVDLILRKYDYLGYGNFKDAVKGMLSEGSIAPWDDGMSSEDILTLQECCKDGSRYARIFGVY